MTGVTSFSEPSSPPDGDGARRIRHQQCPPTTSARQPADKPRGRTTPCSPRTASMPPPTRRPSAASAPYSPSKPAHSSAIEPARQSGAAEDRRRTAAVRKAGSLRLGRGSTRTAHRRALATGRLCKTTLRNQSAHCRCPADSERSAGCRSRARLGREAEAPTRLLEPLVCIGMTTPLADLRVLNRACVLRDKWRSVELCGITRALERERSPAPKGLGADGQRAEPLRQFRRAQIGADPGSTWG
jgi:hypothetical protein